MLLEEKRALTGSTLPLHRRGCRAGRPAAAPGGGDAGRLEGATEAPEQANLAAEVGAGAKAVLATGYGEGGAAVARRHHTRTSRSQPKPLRGNGDLSIAMCFASALAVRHALSGLFL